MVALAGPQQVRWVVRVVKVAVRVVVYSWTVSDLVILRGFRVELLAGYAFVAHHAERHRQPSCDDRRADVGLVPLGS